MPSLLNDVWGSTLQDKTHRGPNQAGNKGMLSYNSSVGVPGYTGFCSTSHAVVLPLKCFEHTGRPVDTATRDATLKAVLDTNKPSASEYTACYKRLPGDTAKFSKTGGGYWITSQAETDHVPFRASTTYREEMANGASNAESQLRKSMGLSCTLSQYEAARNTAPRSQSAEPTMRASARFSNLPTSPTQRPPTVTTATGELVGYQTTTHSMLKGVQGSPEKTAQRTRQPSEESNRWHTMPRAMPPGMYGSETTYVKDFGADGTDPMCRGAPSERFQTRCATGADLAAGTTRVTNNPPGYTGHIAASKYNALGQAQSAAPDERLDRKSDSLLYHLDQYSCSRLPGYTGYKPQDGKNVTLIQPSQGPAKNTTSGAAALEGTKYVIPHNDNKHHINSRTGIMDFFTSKGVYVSDNGLTNAQEYWKLCPPGNVFKHSALSHFTHYGKKFNPANSQV